jgi:hypothetical protein
MHPTPPPPTMDALNSHFTNWQFLKTPPVKSPTWKTRTLVYKLLALMMEAPVNPPPPPGTWGGGGGGEKFRRGPTPPLFAASLNMRPNYGNCRPVARPPRPPYIDCLWAGYSQDTAAQRRHQLTCDVDTVHFTRIKMAARYIGGIFYDTGAQRTVPVI